MFQGKFSLFLFSKLKTYPLMIKNIKVALLVLIFPLLVDMGIACTPNHKSDGGLYSNKSFSVSNLDNSGRNTFITTTDSVLKKAYGIRLHLVREIFVTNKSPQYIFIQSAYADSPPIYYHDYLPLDSIVSMQIFTINDFDDFHPAGSEITDYFKVYQNYSFTPIKEYLNKASKIYSHLSDLQVDIDMLLMTAPIINTKHQFKIQIKLSDGRILTQETTMINLI